MLGAVALTVGCLPPQPEPQPPPRPCPAVPAGVEAIGTQRYLEPVFANAGVTCGLVYGQAPDEHGKTQVLALDLYRPAGDTTTDRPVLVWAPPGGFVGGQPADGPTPDYAARFARRGYVVAAIDYRIREGSTFSYRPPFQPDLLAAATDAQHDAQAAVRWLRIHAADYGMDPDRIAIAGISAGGMTAMMVNYDEDDVGTSGNPGVSSAVAAAVSLEGCALDLSVIDGGEGPALLVHATADSGVPYQCAVDTANAATAVGDIAELDPRSNGEDHAFTIDPAQAVGSMSQFLYDHFSGP